MDQNQLFVRTLESRYGLKEPELAALRLEPAAEGPRLYHVHDEAGGRWVLRACAAKDSACDVDRYAAILEFLQQNDYPAPRLLRTTNGDPSALLDGGRLIVMSFVRGSVLDYSPASLRALGEALGRLHALPAESASPSVGEAAAWTPGIGVPAALERLDGVRSRVGPDQTGPFDEFREVLASMPDFACLPRALVHSDCYPGNAVRTAVDQVTLLNWDGAGLAPAVIDFGYTVLTCSTALPWAPELGPNVPRITAFVEGYRRHRVLEAVELDALAQATRLTPALMGAECFAAAVCGEGGDEQWKLWLARCRAAESSAQVASEILQLLTSCGSD